MTIDRAVSAALDRVAAGEPVDEVADDYGVPRVFFRAFIDAQELIAAARELKENGYRAVRSDWDRLNSALKHLEDS